MRVVARCKEWAFWYCLEENGSLYLLVECQQGAVSYPLMMPLNARQAAAYQSGGEAYLEALAGAVNDNTHEYSPHRVSDDRLAGARKAVRAWEEQGEKRR